jgi:hypothetical protein
MYIMWVYAIAGEHHMVQQHIQGGAHEKHKDTIHVQTSLMCCNLFALASTEKGRLSHAASLLGCSACSTCAYIT